MAKRKNERLNCDGRLQQDFRIKEEYKLRRELTPQMRKRVREMWLAGIPRSVIAMNLGISKYSAYVWSLTPAQKKKFDAHKKAVRRKQTKEEMREHQYRQYRRMKRLLKIGGLVRKGTKYGRKVK